MAAVRVELLVRALRLLGIGPAVEAFTRALGVVPFVVRKTYAGHSCSWDLSRASERDASRGAAIDHSSVCRASTRRM